MTSHARTAGPRDWIVGLYCLLGLAGILVANDPAGAVHRLEDRCGRQGGIVDAGCGSLSGVGVVVALLVVLASPVVVRLVRRGHGAGRAGDDAWVAVILVTVLAVIVGFVVLATDIASSFG